MGVPCWRARHAAADRSEGGLCMSFSGKATYDGGVTMPEIMEDVSDLVSIVSPFETPLLDHLGDPKRAAVSTLHEWVEDALLPNRDTINQASFTPNATTATSITVNNGNRFQIGDQVRPAGSREIMFVTAVAANVLTVTRTYGGTPSSALSNGQVLHIVGNAALEGANADSARFTTRQRRQNITQIFRATVQVSGTMQAVRKHGVSDELDYQTQERVRELLRDLENSVINGAVSTSSPIGSSTQRRTMNGIIRQISTNQLQPGTGGMPSGGGGGGDELNEELLNAALRRIWESSNGPVDTIVVGGAQKRRINEFLGADQRYSPDDETFKRMVSVYESDFGICRVLLSRWMPADTVLLLDSSRIEVLPLAGRSFHFKPLAAAGDSDSGLVLGEYTIEFRNELAHGLVRGLASA